MSKAIIDWSSISQLYTVEKEPLVCFRLIPDRSVSNRTNFKFFKDVVDLQKVNLSNQIFSNLGKLYKTVSKKSEEGFKFVYKVPSNYIWYEVVMKEGSINFYVICFKKNAEFVSMKLGQIFPGAPIEEVELEETKIPEENTVVADVKLKRHNYFSLRTDYSEQVQPIEDILACSDDLRDDDVLKLSMRVQPFDQSYWSYKCEKWNKAMMKGSAPRRLRLSKQDLSNLVFELSDITFNKLSNFFQTLHEVAFKKYRTKQDQHQVSTQETREIGELSRRTNYKSTAPVFKSVIRVASHSKEFNRRNMNMKSLTNSFIDLKDSNNSLVRTAVYEEGTRLFKQAHAEVSEQRVTSLSTTDTDFMILSDKEAGKIMQLPTSTIQKKYGDRLESIRRLEVGIPVAFRDSSGVLIGTAEYKGEKENIYIPDKNPDEFNLPIIISGIMGAGKDVLAINYIIENALKGRGAVIPDVIDEKGRGMSDTIIRSLPPEKVVVLDFGDVERVPYLDWIEGMRSNDRFAQNRFSSELLKFFEAEDEAGVQTERFLKEAAKAVPDATVIQMGLLFTSEEFRTETIKKCKKRGDLSTAAFWETFNAMGEGRQKQVSDPVLNRIHKLIGDPALKPIFGQKANGSIRFDDWLHKGKVIICKIPKVQFGTNGVRTLVHWIMVKTWLAKQAMAAERKCDSILVLNEPHQFLTKSTAQSLEEMYPESRKYGLCIMSLFHDFAQIPKNLADVIVASGCNFILLKQRSEKTWKKFEHRIEGQFTIEDCMQLNMHEAMVGFLSNKQDQPVIRVKLNNVPEKRGVKQYNNSKHIEYCRTTYGRPIKEVEKEIFEDEMKLLAPKKKKAKK
ncbi:hypothetical protein F373_gp203 [Bacillus phage SP-10]|uniref:hypothetical protein n=1 Tax=Bacillus phage SP10 TaxID=941058 RepID=UPI0002198B9F|nr:hypothetical protein F373_gp203 [Bacillus phage SP-10]BAK53015.1 hypothetical protein [Bacillus phage SP-10]